MGVVLGENMSIVNGVIVALDTKEVFFKFPCVFQIV